MKIFEFFLIDVFIYPRICCTTEAASHWAFKTDCRHKYHLLGREGDEPTSCYRQKTIVLNIWRCHESAWSCDVTVILLRTKCRWRKTVTNCLQPNHLHCRGVKYRHRVRCCVSEIRWCLACSSSKDCTRRMEIEGGFCLFFVSVCFHPLFETITNCC